MDIKHLVEENWLPSSIVIFGTTVVGTDVGRQFAILYLI